MIVQQTTQKITTHGTLAKASEYEIEIGINDAYARKYRALLAEIDRESSEPVGWRESVGALLIVTNIALYSYILSLL